MTSASLHEAYRLAEKCQFNRRMPAHASRLAEAASQLDDNARLQLSQFMLDADLPYRMAWRACQAAPSSLIGAERIIDALVTVIGREKTLIVLREIEYDRRICTCIRKFASSKKRRFKAALDLCAHLQNIFGDCAEVQAATAAVRQNMQPVVSLTA